MRPPSSIKRDNRDKKKREREPTTQRLVSSFLNHEIKPRCFEMIKIEERVLSITTFTKKKNWITYRFQLVELFDISDIKTLGNVTWDGKETERADRVRDSTALKLHRQCRWEWDVSGWGGRSDRRDIWRELVQRRHAGQQRTVSFSSFSCHARGTTPVSSQHNFLINSFLFEQFRLMEMTSIWDLASDR